MFDYKAASAFPDIRAAEANGWEPWREDAAGVLFYRRRNSLPLIHAAADDGTDGADEIDDDRECQFYEIDAAGERVALQGMEHLGRIRGIPKPSKQSASDEGHLRPYYKLLESTIAGETIEAGIIDEILDIAGKTPEDFDADVAELHRLNMELGSDD